MNRSDQAAVLRDPADQHRPQTETLRAARDIVDGALMWPFWGTLAWYDIRQRYRRSKIGPFWLTISIAVMIASMGGLYSGLLRTNTTAYIPHIAIGFVAWNFIAAMINDGCGVFISGQASIRQVRLPLSIYLYREVWRNTIIFTHNLSIVLIVLIIFGIRPGWIALLALPAVMVLGLSGIWMGLLLALVSTRFRDVPPIVATALPIAFFVTPIIWQPQALRGWVWIVVLNPFFYLLEIVRAPLLGEAPSVLAWVVVLGMTALGLGAATTAYIRYRGRVAYWI